MSTIADLQQEFYATQLGLSQPWPSINDLKYAYFLGVKNGNIVAGAASDTYFANLINTTSATKTALSVTYAVIDPNALTSGESTIPRLSVSTGSQSMTSGVIRLTYFTARKTETIASLRILCGTAAAATPSLVRAGIWTVAGNGDLTLVASIASDTTLFATQFTSYTRALTAPLSKVARTRYAFGLLVVTAATAPTVYGNAGLPTSLEAAVAPQLSSVITAQTDIGDLTADQVTASTNMIYAVLVP